MISRLHLPLSPSICYARTCRELLPTDILLAGRQDAAVPPFTTPGDPSNLRRRARDMHDLGVVSQASQAELLAMAVARSCSHSQRRRLGLWAPCRR